MATFYGPQVTQVNEKPPQEPSLDLMLMQHPHDENPELQEVPPCLEVEPVQAWYYHISLNSCTLVILLQVNLVSNDEPKTFYEGFYKTEYTSIFTWFSIIGVGHYHWLHSPIH
jgi:hypothetical protein